MQANRTLLHPVIQSTLFLAFSFQHVAFKISTTGEEKNWRVMLYLLNVLALK